MEHRNKNTLKKHRVQLAKELISEEVLQVLIANGILNDVMFDKIASRATNFDKNVELLSTLTKRGPEAFRTFVDALMSTDQHHLALLLQDADVERGDAVPCTRPDHQSTSASFSATTFSFSSPENSRFLPKFSSSVSSSPPPRGKNVSPRRPTENVDRSPDAHGDDSHSSSPAKRRCTEEMTSQSSTYTVPSPCNELDDILCTSSTDDLVAAANLSLPKSQNVASTFAATAAKSSSKAALLQFLPDAVNQPRVPLDIGSMDLTDGPTQDDLVVRRSTFQFQHQHFMDSYEMCSSPRGLALIISVDRFEPSTCLENREAGDVDRARLEFVLRQIGFKCYSLVDGTAKEIWNVLQKFTALEDHRYADCCMVAVMSHGEQGCFFGRDGNKVDIEHVLQLFGNENCPGLQNKPKILLFQCCRGSNPDKGVDEMDAPTRSERVNSDRIMMPESDIISRASSQSSIYSNFVRNKLPARSDMLIGYATVKGYAAMRNTKQGSWYIQALVRVLAFHSCEKHLIEMMTMVNNLVKQREGWCPSSVNHRCKEMSEFQSTLCKKLFLIPGQHQVQ
ncbi:caspase-2-like [Clavelina lepadiformis]|uniref:caspase-2-like n=1 Tax=Clavelina lepadiformis TaxID=159417 RepID=UPI004042890C